MTDGIGVYTRQGTGIACATGDATTELSQVSKVCSSLMEGERPWRIASSSQAPEVPGSAMRRMHCEVNMRGRIKVTFSCAAAAAKAAKAAKAGIFKRCNGSEPHPAVFVAGLRANCELPTFTHASSCATFVNIKKFCLFTSWSTCQQRKRNHLM